ncbi:MAG: hypothetical protein AB4352_00070 [Hormoscilla sp.]
MAFDCDLFVIGAGSGGMAAAQRAASYLRQMIGWVPSHFGVVEDGTSGRNLTPVAIAEGRAFADSFGARYPTWTPPLASILRQMKNLSP